MKTVDINLIALALILIPSLAFAEGRALTLSEYLDGEVHAGDVICEAVLNTCYLTLDVTRTLTDKDDPTGALKKGAVTEKQAQFTRVTIAQIVVELEHGKIKPDAPADIYLKVDWTARDNGPIGMDLNRKDIVHGKLVQDESGAYKFQVTNIPGMMFLGVDNPSIDAAQVFGLRLNADNEEIVRDMKFWLETLLTAELPEIVYKKSEGTTVPSAR